MTDPVAYFSKVEARPIFCVTTGRSGTQLLAMALGQSVHCVSSHEPAPGFHELRPFVSDQPERHESVKRWWSDVKLPAMYAALRPNGRDGKRYIETSHVFSKGFADALLDLGVVPDLILLRRDPRHTAKSLFELRTIPLRTADGRKWCIAPNDDRAFSASLDTATLSDYQVCFLYCLEVEARAERLAAEVASRGGRTLTVDFADLLDGSYLAPLAARFNLRVRWRARLRRALAVNRKVNAKGWKKSGELDYDQCRREELDLYQRLGDLGRSISSPTEARE